MDAVSGHTSRFPAGGKPLYGGRDAGRRQDVTGGSIRCVRTSLHSRGGGVPARVSHGSGFSRVGISFCDNGSLRYYGPGGRSGGGIVRAEKGKGCGMERKKGKEGRKRKKMMRGLAEDIRAFSAMGFGIEDGGGLVGDDQAMMVAEAAQTLLAQLERLQAEEMEMKRKNKEEKAAMKTARMKTKYEEMCDKDSSLSSSSESSDSDSDSDGECEVVNMKNLRTSAIGQTPGSLGRHQKELLPELGETQVVAKDIHSKPPEAHVSVVLIANQASMAVTEAEAMKVEVCMGGKCKKSGAVELVHGFERVLGVDGAVSACKCLGKCREGPNVRILSTTASAATGEVRVELPPPPPICVGVGLEDIEVIVSKYFGKTVPGLLAA